jgi:hypothetical protein
MFSTERAKHLTPDTGRTLQDGVVVFSTDFRNSGNTLARPWLVIRIGDVSPL